MNTKISTESFSQWAKTKETEYASVTVRGERLRFVVNLYTKEYTVTHGKTVLYKAYGLEEAIDTYNIAVDRRT